MKKTGFISAMSAFIALSMISCAFFEDETEDYWANKDEWAAENTVVSKYSSKSDDVWGCHDPKLFQDSDGTYYAYSTGWGERVELRSSKDMVTWKKKSISVGVDSEFQSWVNSTESWAPTVIKQNGKYYMFHGIITGTSPNLYACITLAISDSPEGPFIPASQYNPSIYKTSTLVRYAWSSSDSGYEDTYNVGGDWNTGFGGIDPEFVFDVATGSLKTYTIGSTTCYAVTYGSWKGGIALIYVDAKTLKPICTTAGTSAYNNVSYAEGDVMDAPVDSISGNQGKKLVGGSGAGYEGAQLIYNSSTGYYYMFVSMGDLTYEYRVGVGRSDSIDGPYLDAGGANMASVTTANYHSIGSKILGAAELDGEYGWRSPGGQSILRARNGKIMLASHSRTTFMSGDFVLRLQQMFFNSEGWPVLNQNDYYAYYSGYTSSGTESLSALTLSDIAGEYSTILTVRGTDTSTLELAGNSQTGNTADGTATESVSMYISSDGTIYGDGSSSSYTGTVTLGSNGAATITLKNASGTALGTFYGYFLHAVDFAKKSSTFSDHRTITFTTLCSDTSATEKGEYFWGNRVSN